jgi:hypothetical protein
MMKLKDQIVSGISDTVVKTILQNKHITNNIGFHNLLQHNLSLLSRKYGFTYDKEYPVANRGDGRIGFIDVAWFDNSSLKAVIEIDSRLRKKSFFKLKSTDATYKIWVCYSNDTIIPADKMPDDIIVIHHQR